MLGAYWCTQFNEKIRDCVVKYATMMNLNMRRVCKRWKLVSDLHDNARARCKEKNKRYLSSPKLAWIVEIKLHLHWLQLQKLCWVKLFREVGGSFGCFECTVTWSAADQQFVIYTQIPHTLSAQVEFCDASTMMARFASWWITEVHLRGKEPLQWIFCKPTQGYWQGRVLTPCHLDYWLLVWLQYVGAHQVLIGDIHNCPMGFTLGYIGPEIFCRI